MVKTLQILLLQDRRADFYQTWQLASGLLPIIVCSNDDLFYGKVKFGNFGFSIGKMNTVDFSETTEACDLNIGRYRQLIEFMKVCK